MLCRACCTRGEEIGKATETSPTCAAACLDSAVASLGQHQALAVFCTGWSSRDAKDLCIPQFWTTQGISENPALLEQLKNKKNVIYWIPASEGVKHLSFSLTADHLFCCTRWIISGTRRDFAVGDSFPQAQQPGTAAASPGLSSLLTRWEVHSPWWRPGAPSKLFFPVMVELIFAASTEWH